MKYTKNMFYFLLSDNNQIKEILGLAAYCYKTLFYVVFIK